MRAAWVLPVAAAAVLAAMPACAQDAPVPRASDAVVAQRPAPKGPYRIAGTILSASDGHPLRGATVRILPANRGPAVDETTADESGQFAFTGVPAGTFVLEGAAPGFVSSLYDQHGEYNTGIVTGAGVDTESLVLALQPEGTIRMTVTDESGEPVDGAQIHLFRKSADAADGKPLPGPSGRTDDLGRWESPALQPGTFYVVVQAAPWYAVHPMHMEGDGARFGFVDSIQPALDVAYPITYYPGATDESAATPVEVHGGDPVELSMQLRAEPAYTIKLPAPPAAEPQEPGARTNVPPTYTQVTRTVFGQTQFVQAQQTNTSAGVEISGLAPGDYTLHRRTGADEGPATAVRITDHSLVAEAPSESQMAHVVAEVRAVDNTRVTRPTQVLVFRNGEIYRREPVDVSGTASFDIDPGDYTLSVQGGGRSLKLKQVLADEKPLPGNRIHLTAGAQSKYLLSVAPGNHVITGVVERGAKPAAGVFVLIIPTADLKDPQTFYRDQSDLDGSFHIPGIAAGDYTLFAVQHGWELDWHDKATYERYLEHATAVHVSDGGDSSVKLSGPVQAQAR